MMIPLPYATTTSSSASGGAGLHPSLTKPPPPTRRLVSLASLVLLFHVLNAVLQERVFHLPEFSATILLGCLQALCITALAWVDFRRQGLSRRAPLTVYVTLSVFSAASTILTNEASRLVNYPTQVVFKSSKLLFVMALRAVALKGKLRTSLGEVVSAISIVLGLILFTWATSEVTQHSTALDHDSTVDMFVGVVSILVAVSCDALLYIGEERFCFRQYGCSNTEVILFCNCFAFLYASMALCASGDMVSSLVYAVTYPSMLVLVVSFSLCNIAGTSFLLQIVSEFGSSTAVVVTSTRKVVTVLCSYVVFPKPFTATHAAGLAAVVYGVWLHDQARKKDHAKTKMDASDATLEPAGPDGGVGPCPSPECGPSRL